MVKSNLPYNVMRHTDWDRAPRDPISAAIAAWSIGSTSAAVAAGVAAGTMTLGFTYYAVYALSSIAISMVTSAVLGALAPKPDFGANTSGQLLSSNKDALAPANFIYGQVRKGGTITYIETTGDNNKVLHQIISLAAHEVEEIGDIYLNDELVTMSSENVTSAPFNGYAKIYKHTGNQTSATDAFSNSPSSLANTLHQETGVGSEFVGKGIAYLYCRFEHDQDAFAEGLPTVTAVVKGKKVKKTINGVEQAPAYSTNAAWVIRDYLTSEYGLGDDSIDYATFEAAAELCDDTTVLSDGSPQYTINGVIRADQSVGSVLQQFMTSCGGTLFWGAGSWRLFAGGYVAPTKTLTLDDFRSGISLDTKVSMRDNFNGVRGTYVDAANDFISADYPQVTSTVFESEDNGKQKILDLQLPFTTNSIAAQRLAKQMLYRSREQLSLSASFGMNAFDIEVGDFIKLRNERYGWGEGSEKTFEVTGWKLNPSSDTGDLRVDLQLRESSQSAYGFGVSDERTIVSNNTTLLKYYEVPDIGVLVTQEYREVNENVVNVLVVQVQSNAIERIDSVILKYKKTSDTSFKSVGRAILVNEGNDAGRFEIVGIDVPQIGEAPINYTVSVTPVNTLGYRGSTTTTSFNATADTTPPASPTNLTNNLSGGTIFFQWDSVGDLDLSHYKLYYNPNPAASFTTASTLPVINKIARPATSITYPALAGKFFVSAVDKTGNESVTAASSLVTAAELPALNTSNTDTESPAFSGSKSNLTVSGGSLTMTAYSTSGSSGTYDFYHEGNSYFDVGTSRTVRLSFDLSATRKHLDAVSGEVNFDDIPDNWDTWPDNFDDWTDETTDFGDFDVVVQARAASTTGGLSTANWASASGEIVGRYVEFRAILSNTNPKVTPNITALSATVEY